MSYGIVLAFDGVTEKDYWAVNDKLGIDRDGNGEWPVGLLSHSAGPTTKGWVVMEIWDAKASQEKFMAGRLGEALASVGVKAMPQIIETNTVNYQTPR